MLHNKYLKAEESIVIGKSHAEIEAAVDIIMGRKPDAWLSPIHVSQWPADIVTLDQQLGHDHLQGTDIAAALAEEKFQGVVCILSGGSEEDMAKYLEMPGVDMVISKAINYQQIAKALLEKHVAKKAEIDSNELDLLGVSEVMQDFSVLNGQLDGLKRSC
jgi:hypothetical protein